MSLTFQLPLIHEGLQRHLFSRICSSVVLWTRISKRKNPRNTIWSEDDIPGMTWITFSIYGTHSMFNSPIVSTGKKAVYCLNYTKTQTMTLLSKHEKRDSKRLPNAANLSKSLILSLFLYFFTCFVTEDRPSQHGYRQCLEYRQYRGTGHILCMREHIRSMHHPPSGHWIRLLFILWTIAE